MKTLLTTQLVVDLMVVAVCAEKTRSRNAPTADSMVAVPKTELQIQFELLQQDIQERNRTRRFGDETDEPNSLILESDRDPGISSQGPVPLRARTKPPVVPDRSIRVAHGEPAEGTLAVMRVYDTLKPRDKDTKTTDLNDPEHTAFIPSYDQKTPQLHTQKKNYEAIKVMRSQTATARTTRLEAAANHKLPQIVLRSS